MPDNIKVDPIELVVLEYINDVRSHERKICLVYLMCLDEFWRFSEEGSKNGDLLESIKGRDYL